MEKSPKLIGYYNYTVILTYIGMLISFFGIICAIEGKLDIAMFCLASSAVCDMFDGTIARTRKRTDREKSFGIQIDSFSDIVCFGIFPGIFNYIINRQYVVSLIVSMLFVLCALIRLAYYNVDELDRTKEETGVRKYYLGLPVTMAGYLIPTAYLILRLVGNTSYLLITILMIIIEVAFVTPFKIKKDKKQLIVFGVLFILQVALWLVFVN